MKFIVGFVFCLLLQLYSLHAQEVLSINESINIALKENLNIQLANNNNKIAENNINIGNANMLPRFDLTASSTYNDNMQNILGNKSYSSFTVNNVGVRGSYTLFDGLSNYSVFNRLKISGEISNYDTRAITENIIVQVINSFYGIANLQDQLNIAKESMTISRERLARQKNKLEFGQSSNIDYLSAEVDFNRDSLTFITVRNNLIQAKQNFNKLLNRNITQQFAVNNKVTFEELPSEEELTDLAFENNAEYKSALERINLAKTEVNISRALFFPSLSLEGSYGFNTTANEFDINFDYPNRSFFAGINLSYNLFNGFRNGIQYQNNKIQLDNAQLSEKNEKLSLLRTLSNVYQLYDVNKTALSLEQSSLKTAQLNFEKTKDLYNLGKVTLTQFRVAQLNLINSKNKISELKYSIKQNETELKRIAGILLNDYK